MKNLIFILFCFVLLSRCDSKDSVPKANATLGTTLQTKALESLEVTKADQTYLFTVKVISITDSRCPMNANCIWAGEASVVFSVANTEFILKIGELKVVEVGSDSYTVELQDVVPFPELNSSEPKTAVYTVKLN